MKLRYLIAIGGLILMSFNQHKKLEIGESAPLSSYEMKDISGKSLSLDQLKGENGLLVIYSCNTCPYVIAWEKEYNKLFEIAKREKMGMVLINSNEGKREGVDSMEEMKKHAKEENYTMPYVIDKDNQLADAFGANTTPHIYLFDAKLKLAYTGLIDNMYDNKDRVATEFYLMDAMVALGNGLDIKLDRTQNRGCSIKRKHS